MWFHTDDTLANGLGSVAWYAADMSTYATLAQMADVPITAMYMADCESMIFAQAVLA